MTSEPALGTRLLLLLGAFAALLFLGLDTAPLERAEIYFMDGARSMVERHDYLVPRYRGEPFFDKPALAYWLMAGVFRVFGFTPAAARLVSVAAALATIGATAWLGTLLLKRRVAMAGCAILATTLGFVLFGRVAMADMLLTLWSTLALSLAAAARTKARRWHVPALGAVLGLGFMTKGPVAVLLAGLGIALLWRRKGERPAVDSAGIVLALLLFGVIGLGWFAGVYAQLGAGPLAYFFLRENLERFAGETYDAGRGPWFYLEVYTAEALPWSLFLPLAILHYFRTKDAPGRDSIGLLLGWIGLMALPLSLSRGKIDYYLLPLYPAAALVVAWLLVDIRWGRLERTWARGVLLAAVILLIGVAALPARIDPEWLPGLAGQVALVVTVAGGCIVAVVVAREARGPLVLAGLATTIAAVLACAFGVFLPAFAASQPNADIVEDVVRERRYRVDASVVLCDDPVRVQRDLLFHARVVVHERCGLWDRAASRHPFLLLLSPAESASLSVIPNLRVVSEHRYLPATLLTVRGLLGRTQPGRLVLVANYDTEDPVAQLKWRRDRKRALKALE